MSLPRLKVESNEFLRLDVIRFCASVGVMLHHWKSSLLLPGTALASAAAGSQPATNFPRLQLLELSVDIFFVISGVVIARVYAERVTDRKSYGQYLIRRIARIYPLHLLTLLLVAGLWLRASSLGLTINGDNTLPSFLRNVFLVNAWWRFPLSFNIVAWSISVEWLCYLLFPLMLSLQRRMRWTWIAACCVPVVLSLCSSHMAGHFFQFGVLRGLLGFYVGVGMQRHAGMVRRWPLPGWVSGLLLAVALSLGLAGVAHTHLYAFAFAIPMVAFVADGRRGTSRFVRGVAPLSQLTFSIYMWHVPFAMLFGFGWRYGLRPLVWNALVVLSVVPLLLLSYVSFVALEDPARTWISRLAGGRRSRSPVVCEAEQLAP